jgi:hypothetical protein
MMTIKILLPVTNVVLFAYERLCNERGTHEWSNQQRNMIT